MFKPASVFIGLRYTRAKRRKHFISVISMISMLCFAVGVMTLIAVLSVMNGFDEQIRKRVFNMAPQVTVSTLDNVLPEWQSMQDQLASEPHVQAVAPYVAGQGLITAWGRQAHAAFVFGILPESESQISAMADNFTSGRLTQLAPGNFGIVLGSELASELGVQQGDAVNIITPTATMTPVGIYPRVKAFKVVGIFDPGPGFGFNNSYAYIHLADAQKLYRLRDNVSGLRLALDDVYLAPEVAQAIQASLPLFYQVSDWSQKFGAFFEAVALEKTMMAFILSLIILVAAFSLISTLFMVVMDKEADIAILRTLGATPQTILQVFMVQGFLIGLTGTLLGLILGLLLASHATAIADWLQKAMHISLLSSKIYYVDYLPSKILWQDVVLVCVIALFFSLLATLIPAWRGSRVQPAEALRFE